MFIGCIKDVVVGCFIEQVHGGGGSLGEHVVVQGRVHLVHVLHLQGDVQGLGQAVIWMWSHSIAMGSTSCKSHKEKTTQLRMHAQQRTGERSWLFAQLQSSKPLQLCNGLHNRP